MMTLVSAVFDRNGNFVKGIQKVLENAPQGRDWRDA